MDQNTLPLTVSPNVYDENWCDEMGGTGSNELFIQSKGQIVRPRLAYILNLGIVQPGMSVLDIGCGRGEVIIKCAEAGASPAIGLDYAPVSLQTARKNIERMKLKVNSAGSPLILNGADVKSLPLSNESFDCIFMLDVVEHLYEWELQQVWSEIRRLLKPNGLLVIHTLPNRWAIDYGYKLARVFVRGLPTKIVDKRDIFHVNEQSVISMSRSLANGGLKSRVWLEDQMLAQANWLEEMQVVGEKTQLQVYSALQRPVWRTLYRLAIHLPIRLLVVTDLFAIAWKSDTIPEVLQKIPRAYTERFFSLLGGRGEI